MIDYIESEHSLLKETYKQFKEKPTIIQDQPQDVMPTVKPQLKKLAAPPKANRVLMSNFSGFNKDFDDLLDIKAP